MNNQISTNEDNKKKIRKKVSLSATKGYEKEVAYLSEQPNKSQYVWNLVRKDMEQKSTDNQILEIVKQAMSNVALGGLPVTQTSQPKKVDNSTDLKRKKGALSILGD